MCIMHAILYYVTIQLQPASLPACLRGVVGRSLVSWRCNTPGPISRPHFQGNTTTTSTCKYLSTYLCTYVHNVLVRVGQCSPQLKSPNVHLPPSTVHRPPVHPSNRSDPTVGAGLFLDTFTTPQHFPHHSPSPFPLPPGLCK